MDVSSVMNTYNMTSLWNSINPNGTSGFPSVPMIDNIDASVQNNYLEAGYSGKNTDTELQDIYRQVEPDLGIPMTYDNSGNLTIPANTSQSGNSLWAEDSNILPLLQSGESSSDLFTENILNQYSEIENGTYQNSVSSILSSNPYNMYNSINSFAGSQLLDTGSSLDVSA